VIVGKRQPNHCRLKKRRTYTVEELATQLHVHKNTVREWYRRGLEALDDRRPMLFRGSEVRAFLRTRQGAQKQPLGPGRLYCLRCRAPREPAAGMLDYLASSSTAGSLRAMCPVCESLMFRRVSFARLGEVAENLEVQFPSAQPQLIECALPILNRDSELERSTA